MNLKNQIFKAIDFCHEIKVKKTKLNFISEDELLEVIIENKNNSFSTFSQYFQISFLKYGEECLTLSSQYYNLEEMKEFITGFFKKNTE